MLKYPRVLLLAGPRLLWDYTFYLWRYARHPERTPIEKRYAVARKLVIFILDHFRIDWKIDGIENLRELEKKGKPFLLVANHMSDVDPLAIVYLSEKPISFVAKKETRKMPFIGTAVKALDGFFMDRSDLRQSIEVIRGVQKRLEEGHCSYMIFPEGTRNRAPETTGVASFHPGSFKAGMLPKAPIIPLALYGTWRPFHSRPDYKRNPVEFTFFKPYEAEDYATLSSGEMAITAQTAIQKQVDLDKNLDAEFLKEGKEKIPLRKGPVR
jgi:1-acyl-sn-glycerol-3-phosphate acyltransferase